MLKIDYPFIKSTAKKIRAIIASPLMWLTISFVLFNTLPAFADDGWDGVSYEAPSGSGSSKTDPYVISKPEHLEWMRVQNQSFAGKYFRQDCDISLNNQEWKVMNANTTNSSTYQGFAGKYDGQGYTLSDYVIYWDNYSETISYGFFCWIGQEGAVENLNVCNARITRHERGTPGITFGADNAKVDIKMGVLVGALGNKATVRNVSIYNSRIDDGGSYDDGTSKSRPFTCQTFIVGGVIGDIMNYFGGSSDIGGANMPTLKNLSSNVDIDLTHCRRIANAVAQYTQFNVGGIVGRMRKLNPAGLPSNTIYSGNVKAPMAVVGPVWSMSRYATTDASSYTMSRMAAAYAGERSENTPAFSTPESSVRSFYNYRIYNHVADTPGWEQITSTNPAGGSEGWVAGTRTLRKNNVDANITTLDGSTNITEALNNPLIWARLQGVNNGSSIDADTPEGLKTNIENKLNNFNNEGIPEGLQWVYLPESGIIRIASSSNYSFIGSQTNTLDYSVTVAKHPDTDDVSAYRFRWYATVLKHDGTTSERVLVKFDENAEGSTGTQLRFTDEIYSMLKNSVNDGYDFSYTADLTLSCDLLRLDTDTDTESPIIGDDSQPLIVNITPTLPTLSIPNPKHYESESIVDDTAVYTGAYHFRPAMRIGGALVDNDTDLTYHWQAQDADGNWIDFIGPDNAVGNQSGYLLPATYARQVRLMVTYSDTSIALPTATFNLTPMSVTLVPTLPDAYDEQQYTLKTVNQYTNDMFYSGISIDWQLNTPYDPLPDNQHSVSVYNSHISNSVKDYTISATVLVAATDPSLTHPVNVDYKYLRLHMDIAEDNTDLDNPAFVASLTLKHSDLETSEHIPFTGNATGTWHWWEVDNSTATPTYTEVLNGAPAGISIEISADGLSSTLRGYDEAKEYRATWISDIASYADASGAAVTLSEQYMPQTVLYVYNPNCIQPVAYAQATSFDGLDPDGVPYPAGNDANSGRTPWTALSTMAEAYKRLPYTRDMDRNVIVLMGAVGQISDFVYDSSSTVFNKPAHITGKWKAVDRNGKPLSGENPETAVDYGGALALFVVIANSTGNATSQTHMGVWGATHLSDVSIYAHNNHTPGNPAHETYFYANKNDLIIDRGVTFKNLPLINATSQGLEESVKLPAFTLIAGHHNYNLATPPTSYMPYNIDPLVTTITVRSAGIARLIGCARNNTLCAVSHNIMGSPDFPFRSRITIDIAPADDHNNNPYYVEKGYTHDMGIITGGQTDGTVWGDIEVTFNRGDVSRYTAGSITYGRRTSDATPDDTFFGRTVLNLYDGNIDELYGGSLGRFGDTSSTGSDRNDPYFYGISIINVYGGTIKSNLYGAGAGGVSGIGTEPNRPGVICHTPDPLIPYYKNGQLLYGPWDVAIKHTIPSLRMMGDQANISLMDTHVEVNVYGGTIKGNIYGGGFGYSKSINVDKAPYAIDPDDKKIGVSGNLYGNTIVRVAGGSILGNVYGGGAGSTQYKSDAAKKNLDIDFTRLAQVHGDIDVIISGGNIGTIGDGSEAVDNGENGNVFGGAQGIHGNPDMGTVFGDCTTHVEGTTVAGNIFGGGDFASVLNRYPNNPEKTATGNIYLTINSGVIGNNIFAGCSGSDGTDGRNVTHADIDGDTHLTVNGGEFLGTPYVNQFDGSAGYRDFNIYGGGYLNCTVHGDAYIEVNRSLMKHAASFMRPDENPNEWPDAISNFQRAYMDITYRRFCVYGGGFGEKTRVLNTHVTVNVPVFDAVRGVYNTKPHGFTLSQFLEHQSFFDIAGGGYNGDVGYWQSNGLPTDDPAYDPADHYVGGRCNVTIDGYTYARKIIGGGFYGSCYSTNTLVRCGSLRQIYGGSLLGYVHQQALLTIGNQIEDMLPAGTPNCDKNPSHPEWANAEAAAKALNDYIYVTENVYGGNDVKGIVGTTKWTSTRGMHTLESSDGMPLFQTDVNPSEEKGVVMNIYGGTFMSTVYGAGNGHYRGYYVPEWVRYNDGPARNYRLIRSSIDPTKTARAYRSRPMVGSVNINIRGNSETDFITFKGDVFGGGRQCTIGQWNTFLPAEDPRRLVHGGNLHINFGGYCNVEGNVYMGNDGDSYRTQNTVPADIDLSTFNGSTTKELMRLGESAYCHWWYNNDTHRYEPGFPPPGEVDGNFGMPGELMLRGYLKNIELQGDVELTFYRQLYKTDDDGNYIIGANGQPQRRRWVPQELAINAYDAEGIHFGNFFLGGRCGSMTNNNVMYYNYNTGQVVPENYAPTGAEAGRLERYGSIYRVSIPKGVTITNSAVMGSQDAMKTIYPYNSKFTSVITTDEDNNPIDPYYRFDGGIVTQSTFAFDHIAYNDHMAANAPADSPWAYTYDLPDDFYTNDAYLFIRNADTYEMLDDQKGTVIHRFLYPVSEVLPNAEAGGDYIRDKRYGLAVYYDDNNVMHSFVGKREERNHSTAVKLGIMCRFSLHDDDEEIGHSNQSAIHPLAVTTAETSDGTENNDVDEGTDEDPLHPSGIDHSNKEGGLIFGGCYNSGVTMGDVILNVASNLLCEHIDPEETENFRDLASLRYNIGRVYGGGYGYNTEIRGNTHVHLLLGFRGMNVFGGGLGGNVTGYTSVSYIGNENSYVFGSIYGGAQRGLVGTKFAVYQKDADGNLVLDADGNPILIDCIDPDTGKKAVATQVGLFSGNVSRVYGGSCMGDLYGSTNVIARDEVIGELDHLDFNHLLDVGTEWLDMSESRLIVGSLYGGNDITGHIHAFGDDVYSTNITIEELPDPNVKTTPGHDEMGYNGFPLIGTVYAGSNGNYGEKENGLYKPGTEVWLHSGSFGERQIDIGNPALGLNKVPTVERAYIRVHGGTIVDLYGGGDDATITGKTHVEVDYESHDARAGFDNTNGNNDPLRIWNLLALSSQEQFNEVIDHNTEQEFVYKYQIHHLYSGNNNADMAIQPDIQLIKGHLGSVYGGGNVGRMTYHTVDPLTNKNKGIEMTINSPRIHIEALYGGGRIGDIQALRPDGTAVKFNKDEYGTTLNVHAGLIEAVYGGNDVSGFVHNGTNVNIYGAIAGDVYCAGNGNYLYQYDTELTPDSKMIYEEYNDVDYGGRYFRLPPKSSYGGKNASDAQKVVAINSYRPNVDKAYLNIQGSKTTETVDDVETTTVNRVWVKGNVYCGGNSSTIHTETPDQNATIKFNIGDHVTLNGVFLGSNGESMTDTSEDGMIQRFEKLNNINMIAPNTLTTSQLPENDATAADATHYPMLLSLYMRGVEVDGVPDEFDFNITEDDSFVGNICLGGNRGSMMTDKTLAVTIPETLTVFGNIVGGCMNTAFYYRGQLHSGGMTRFVDVGANTGSFGDGVVGTIDPTTDEQNKVWLTVKCKFAAKKIDYPVDGDIFNIRLVDDVEYDANGHPYFPHNSCNIYGGCYESGLTIGDIRIDLYSDMLANIDHDVLVNSVSKQLISFDVVGGGYGKMSMLIGDTKVRMLPSGKDENNVVHHPSCSAIFGGSQQGQMIGNTFVSVRDGTVHTNLYGASESALLYGSTNIVIGYPEIYRCQMQGVYNITPVDVYSKAATRNLNFRGNPAIKKQIWLNPGDLVAKNVYDEISSRVDGAASETKDNWFGDPWHLTPADFGVTWDDIDIHIGVNDMYNLDAEFHGHGNVYGGGFVSNNSDYSLAGTPTVKKFDYERCRISRTPEREGYGGNSTIIIGDNPNNSLASFTGATNEALRDHISIGTAHFNKVTLKAGDNKIGKFRYDPNNSNPKNRFIHQESGIITAQDVAANNNVFYELEADGGIYGGGRKVFVEGFRTCDITGYGYADYCPQFPKLLNTIQRIDAITVRDCCLQLVGAYDYASTTIDATLYAIAHIGELNMVSSLPHDTELKADAPAQSSDDDGDDDDEVGSGGSATPTPVADTQHTTPRSRNYIAFLNHVRFLHALSSSTSFDQMHHDHNGVEKTQTYRQFKDEMIADRYDNNVNTFPKRNLGTSHNMLGICNGHTLRIQGQYTVAGSSEGATVDSIYYGPVVGVVEVKMLTLLSDEGGGYIYALNRHKDVAASPTSRAIANDNFTEMTGNFVFPGRAFTSDGSYHYILDDCYPVGYDDLTSNNADPSKWAKTDIHYWYVQGDSYYFNASLTAYTYNKPDGRPKDFYLDNYDNLITLSGVEAGKSTITVKSVTWQSHTDEKVKLSDGSKVDFDCDLTNYARTDVDDGEGNRKSAYSLYLSVDKYTDVNHFDSPTEEITTGAYKAHIPRSNFSDDGAAVTPDGVKPNDTSNGTFGNKPASTNSPSVGIRLRDAIDNSDPDYFQQHLSKPDVVSIVLQAVKNDENNQPIVTNYTINLTINYIQGPKITGNINIDNCALPGEMIFANTGDMVVHLSEVLSIKNRQWILKTPNEETSIDVSDYHDINDYTKLELPVWWHQNGWDLCYRLTINGEPFDVEPSPTAEHRNIEVHNYHRMKAAYGTSEVYQILTPGSRIYIEDQADLDRFLALADTLSTEGYTPRTLPGTSLVDRPANCQGLRFFLRSDLELDADRVVPAAFAGEINGDGHTITLRGNNKNFMGTLSADARIYNTGFHGVSTLFGKIFGQMVNCFYYSPSSRGGFCTDIDADAVLHNCYQNVATSAHGTFASTDDFNYGRVAYNLNELYLKNRHSMLTTGQPWVGEYLQSYYADGQYRYAAWDEQWGVGQPASLRTAARPNYMNYSKSGRSHHAHLTDLDNDRYVSPVIDEETGEVVTPAHWKPFYESDYLMFGQKLMRYDIDDMPSHYTEATRVWRASGFYGSKTDRGFHFNVDAAAMQPQLTAIDFTGERDRGNDPAEGLTVSALREVFFAPMLDLPPSGINSWAMRSNIAIDDRFGITKNVLVYSPETMKPLFSAMEYDETLAETGISGHLVTQADETEPYEVANGLMHLVDMQDFNAPIEFNIASRAWYDRAPLRYSTAADCGWQAICLPFSANRVSAIDNTETESNYSHGEITHFYGDEPSPTDVNANAARHEYWLRSLVGYNDTQGLLFARPGLSAHPFKDANGALIAQLTAPYNYSNQWFKQIYGDEYCDEHNIYTDTPVSMADYRFLTHDVPYIMALPSDRHYEFDLSGKFYKDYFNETEQHPLSMRFEYLVGDLRNVTTPRENTSVGSDASQLLTIGVTDDYARCAYADGYAFMGTFAYKALTSASSGILDDDGDGSAFTRPSSGFEIMPFRAYMSTPGALNAPRRISSPSIGDDLVAPGEGDGDEDNDNDSDELTALEFSVENNVLTVRSPYSTQFTLTDMQGRVVDIISVEPGTNHYPHILPGIYIAHHFKFRIM